MTRPLAVERAATATLSQLSTPPDHSHLPIMKKPVPTISKTMAREIVRMEDMGHRQQVREGGKAWGGAVTQLASWLLPMPTAYCLGETIERVSSGAASRPSARVLSIVEGSPVFVLDRIITTRDGWPAEWRRAEGAMADAV